ncbi:hypothetical protein LEMLEM_LOCUS10899 [Lemmus lemmus]
MKQNLMGPDKLSRCPEVYGDFRARADGPGQHFTNTPQLEFDISATQESRSFLNC